MKASSYPMLAAEEAAALVLGRTPVLGSEEVGLAEATGRVVAEDVVARRMLPAFPASAVDGYAIRSADGGGRLRVAGESAAGRPFAGRLEPGAAARILTGGVLPEGADSVVMVEDVEQLGEQVVVPTGFAAGRNFHAPGADLRPGLRTRRRSLANCPTSCLSGPLTCILVGPSSCTLTPGGIGTEMVLA